MRRRTLICFVASAVTLLSAMAVGFMVYWPPTPAHAVGAEEERPSLDVCFSPEERCTQVVVDTLKQAKTKIFVQAYSFTSTPIAQALVAAHKQKIPVEVMLDRGRLTEQGSVVDVLARGEIPMTIDGCHAKAHNKVIIIDGETVITGSFNFSTGAEKKNAENLLVIRNKALAARYIENWQVHRDHSKPYGRGVLNDKDPCPRPSRKAKVSRP